MNVHDVHEGVDPLKKEATMEVKGHKLLVTRWESTHANLFLNKSPFCYIPNRLCFGFRGWQKDYRRDKRRGSDVYCWFVHNSGKGFIDGHYTDYIVPNLTSFLRTL